MEQQVITTLKGRNYHRPNCNTGFLSARAKGERLGRRKLHPVQTMTEADARQLGKKACGHCGGTEK
ncbi:hypothetical protein QC334_34790 [Streptomyces sp. DH18]|uniref:hypothetical protein n=1 Tax=Streptomyces sp. DH18 TaxID=3040126 RepID=UPI002441981F|nr:hypothetical protein [Streptomyces sp. DH18]MDG9687839.1 hypothetical protein [Streptomyces sp. DH18]